MPETHTPFCESKNVKIVLQTSKESNLKATNQEQTEEKHVTNDNNRSVVR